MEVDAQVAAAVGSDEAGMGARVGVADDDQGTAELGCSAGRGLVDPSAGLEAAKRQAGLDGERSSKDQACDGTNSPGVSLISRGRGWACPGVGSFVLRPGLVSTSPWRTS